MTEPDTSASLRERTRRAVQTELLAIAQTLFAEHGYESTTIDQIATAAGMSRRSFFRYFPSKDAVVLSKYDRLGEEFAEALAARPTDEQPWTALRRMFDDVVAYVADPDQARHADELGEVIQASDTLRAGYLERMQRAQSLVVDRLLARSDGALPQLDAVALVAAAFAALTAANAHARAEGVELAATLDEAMSAIARGAARTTKRSG